MINDQPLTIVIDGQTISLCLNSTEPLVRAVIISLFTWRRANPSDDLPGVGTQVQRMGWWGDSFPVVPNDRIGSRLWLLSRAKLTSETVARAKEYTE
jgi:phage gp46-like protein